MIIRFTKVFTKVNSFEAKLIQILNWYVALDFTETPRYSKCEICYFSLFFLEKWNKIITLKRFRGFSIPSQYSMTLSKRFEWHWSHEWSTKLETFLLLEYCVPPYCKFDFDLPGVLYAATENLFLQFRSAERRGFFMVNRKRSFGIEEKRIKSYYFSNHQNSRIFCVDWRNM